MQAPKNNSKPRPLCPVGLHLLRCTQIVDLGSQRFQGGDPSRKLYFGFETLEQLYTFKEEDGPKPFMLQVEFAFYMRSASDKKTKLRQFVESWFDKAFPSEEEAESFDFSKLIGRLANGIVSHQLKKDGSKKSVIAGIVPPDPGKAKTPWPVINKHIVYEITEGEGADFKYLPPFLQSKIKESDEFKQVEGHEEIEQQWIGEPVNSTATETEEENDSSIPF